MMAGDIELVKKKGSKTELLFPRLYSMHHKIAASTAGKI